MLCLTLTEHTVPHNLDLFDFVLICIQIDLLTSIILFLTWICSCSCKKKENQFIIFWCFLTCFFFDLTRLLFLMFLNWNVFWSERYCAYDTWYDVIPILLYFVLCKLSFHGPRVAQLIHVSIMFIYFLWSRWKY